MTEFQPLPRRHAERYGHLLVWVEGLEIKPREHRVLCHLIRAGDKNLSSWWSYKAIGKKVGMSERTVGTAVRELESLGLVHCRKRSNENGPDTSVITVLAPDEAARMRLTEADRRAANDPRALIGFEPDPGEYRLTMQEANLADCIPEQQADIADKSPDIREVHMDRSRRSAADSAACYRRRGSGPTPAADIFAEIGRAA